VTPAYVAGLIDGEGCLWIQAKAGRWYTPRCDVGMSEKGLPVLRLLHAKYGGSLALSRKATTKWEAAWRWAIGGTACRTLLTEVMPYLELKAEQARLLMDVTATNGPLHKALVSELNRKGPSETQTDGWFARHVAGTWITPQRDLLSSHGWEEFSGTWPRAGSMRNGIAFQHQPLAPLTREIESGLWPAPTRVDGEHPGRVKHKQGQQFALSMAVQRWPTPTSRDWKDGSAQACRNVPANGLLGRVVHQWPTPRSCSAMAATFTEDAIAKAGDRFPNLETVVAQTDPELGGALNPAWVEWLMGYPLGWTVCEGWVTRSSRKSQSGSPDASSTRKRGG
jgi:hypothetical protein